jgi:hypothetical protein
VHAAGRSSTRGATTRPVTGAPSPRSRSRAGDARPAVSPSASITTRCSAPRGSAAARADSRRDRSRGSAASSWAPSAVRTCGSHFAQSQSAARSWAVSTAIGQVGRPVVHGRLQHDGAGHRERLPSRPGDPERPPGRQPDDDRHRGQLRHRREQCRRLSGSLDRLLKRRQPRVVRRADGHQPEVVVHRPALPEPVAGQRAAAQGLGEIRGRGPPSAYLLSLLHDDTGRQLVQLPGQIDAAASPRPCARGDAPPPTRPAPAPGSAA